MRTYQLRKALFYSKLMSVSWGAAVNAVALSKSGTTLATGGLFLCFQSFLLLIYHSGDDQQVTLWEIDEANATVLQQDVIASGFGRITSLHFNEIAFHSHPPLNATILLFIGTAQGWVVVAQEIKVCLSCNASRPLTLTSPINSSLSLPKISPRLSILRSFAKGALFMTLCQP